MVSARRPVVLAAALAVVVPAAAAVSLGTAPGVMNMGELKRGKNHVVPFYLITTSSSPLLASLSVREPKHYLYARNHTRDDGSYRFIPLHASGEAVQDWVSFQRDQVLVDPSREQVVTTQDGTIKYNKKATMLVEVPEDADPGYHAYEVGLSPQLSSGSGGLGITTIGVTRPVFIFRVPGEARRSGTIQGVTAGRRKGKARIDVLFRNTGTVTMRVRVPSLKVYNETGYQVARLRTGTTRVAPGETTILKTYWTDDDPNQQKQRRVEATVDYGTGRTTETATVTVPAARIPVDRTEEPAAERPFPTWLIALLAGFAALILYYRW